MKITSCKTNHIENPLGFHMEEAVVSWVVCDTYSQQQKSARIIVAADANMEEIVYDSGMNASLDSRGVNLPFSLAPMTRYFWTITVEGDKGDTATSDINWFETAKMDSPWEAMWITPPWNQTGDDCTHPYIRKQFSVDKKVAKARAYITGMGIYELHINGSRIVDEYLTPDCNTYDAWVQYQTFDITESMLNGDNTIGVMMANGWAKGRFGTFKNHHVPYTNRFLLICEIHVEYSDGSVDIIGTDEDWLCTSSPILFDNIYDGIIYDANAEIPNWCKNNIDESNWEKMQVTVPRELGKLMARMSLPVKIMEKIKPIAVIKTPAGETVLDMGQNMVGWLRMRIDVPKGTRITISHGEILQHDNFYNDNLRSAKAEYVYISNGTAQEVEAGFTFYGFRFAKIEGLPYPVKKDDFTGCVLYSDLETTGNIITSDEKVNRLFRNILWGQKGNFLDIPTDCPQRDERMGWTGDTQIFAGTAMFNMHSYAFYVKFMHDLFEEQKICKGLVPSIIPQFVNERGLSPSFKNGGACAWGDCATIVPWEAYLHTGDTTILKKQYQSMKSWVDWITQKCKEDGTGLLWTEGFQYGDWLALDNPDPDSNFGGTDTGYLASAYYSLSALLVSKAASILCNDDDAKIYADLSACIKTAMRKQYFTPDGRCTINTQTAHVVALHFDLVEESVRPRIAADLGALLEQNNMHLTTGFIGTPYLCRVLSDNGASDSAYRLFFQEDYPSWLYPVGMDATTIWERWNSVLPNGLISGTAMNSLNHYAYGSIAEWMYRNMCGINPVEMAPGFKEVILKPEPNPQLSFAKAEVKTSMGLVKCGWAYNDNGSITIEAEIPFNTKAIIILPGAYLDSTHGLDSTEATQGDNHVRCKLMPGLYRFTY
ncbi:MAG: glycoside hydrolase family 78 protein [Defluviitaleaceae bacterium]|nr:glycoside hydrolase family 78 protein [Defluviitaleaceae bacterium]